MVLIVVKIFNIRCFLDLDEWNFAIRVYLETQQRRVLRIREGQHQKLTLACVALMQPGMITSEGITLSVL